MHCNMNDNGSGSHAFWELFSSDACDCSRSRPRAIPSPADQTGQRIPVRRRENTKIYVSLALFCSYLFSKPHQQYFLMATDGQGQRQRYWVPRVRGPARKLFAPKRPPKTHLHMCRCLLFFHFLVSPCCARYPPIPPTAAPAVLYSFTGRELSFVGPKIFNLLVSLHLSFFCV